MMRVIGKAVVFLLILSTSVFYGQLDQKQLEARRRELRMELNKIHSLRKINRAKGRSILEEVSDLKDRIGLRRRLILITNKQVNDLTREMLVNQKKMGDYRKELKELKKDYAQMVLKSYKSNSQQSRIMFLLSSENFLQAYKRMQYMKQYVAYRKQQGERIVKRTAILKTLNTTLAGQKEIKQQLINENRREQSSLKQEKLQQQQMMRDIRKKEGYFVVQIRKKQKEAQTLDRKIEKFIREAIAKANAKAGKKASANFALTAESKALAKDFTSNKGKLPWPVVSGRVSKRFGKQPHPSIPNISINNSGVEIETAKGTKARAIFAGEVSTVKSIRGAGKLVQIRHGNYITTYYNLEKINVTEGQKVATKDAIGQVRTNPTNGRSIMKFLIYQNATRLNPQHWIFKM